MPTIDHMPANLTDEQAAAYHHLRHAYVGPENGPMEVLTGVPSLQYIVGMLFPPEIEVPEEETSADVPEGDVEEASEPLAEDWRPSSTAVSFVTDASRVRVQLAFGAYVPLPENGLERWRRVPAELKDITFQAGVDDRKTHLVEGIEIEVGCRWRRHGENWLVTAHVRNRSRLDPALNERALRTATTRYTLYQVDLAVETDGGAIHDYDRGRNIELDAESAELRLRYRKRRTLAVGHGFAARWDVRQDGACTRVWLDPMPAHVVRDVTGREYEPGHPARAALSIDALARIDEEPGPVLSALAAFVADFEDWVRAERRRVEDFSPKEQAVAARIVGRAESTAARMREGVDLLTGSEIGSPLLKAFALAMKAMALQMRQLARVRAGGAELAAPTWRPFQLGFLLTSVASTVDPRHPDRELIDLIWFPTGGGKTEAYLGLAAIEMFLRRFKFGLKGAGTAVITRYTLRLLTSQQFQRSASLICAMETIRREDPSLQQMAAFTIGLWVGNEVTPGTRKDAQEALTRLLNARRPSEVNMFQLTHCPWCLTSLIPEDHTEDESRYGVTEVGGRVVLRCVEGSCAFATGLPVMVVDEDIYAAPPTFLLGTVDKFAQLQFKPEAGRLLGLDTAFRQPSLLIQDELHLLSGPLGTTVAAFEAALQVLLARRGDSPKIVASTATIRSSEEQIRGLYGRPVALYPPASLDEDVSYFSREDKEGHGRLYIGAMPQSLPQATALVAVATPLFELAETTAGPDPSLAELDKYWTAVLYHNSLRELGRTNTLLTDDVNARVEARASRLGRAPRRIPTSGIVELTSRKTSAELRADLGRLEQRRVDKDPADAVLSSNMLSVGIDVSRLALMLMVGQPKTTSEYIQATSRVGRSHVKGIVVSLFRSNRARDRSHFESFQSFHEALYRAVEPTSVTPWSASSRAKSLAGILIALARQAVPPLAVDDAAQNFRLDNPATGGVLAELVEELMAKVEAADPLESSRTRRDLERLQSEWQHRATEEDVPPLRYRRSKHAKAGTTNALLKDFADKGVGWVVATSMRSVDPTTGVEIREPYVREASNE